MRVFERASEGKAEMEGQSQGQRSGGRGGKGRAERIEEKRGGQRPSCRFQAKGTLAAHSGVRKVLEMKTIAVVGQPSIQLLTGISALRWQAFHGTMSC